MSDNIFRQKNIDRINSPESLNDYVKVTNPSVWIVLIGVVVLIIGAIVFGTVGKVDTNVLAAVEVDNGRATVYVDEMDIDKINVGMNVKIDGEYYAIVSIAERAIKASDIDDYVLHKGAMESSKWVYPLYADVAIKNGVYTATITVERVSPISYVFN